MNQDRSPENGSDIIDKAKKKNNMPVKNSSALKYALQEYAPSIETEKQNTLKLRKKVQMRYNTITGEITKDSGKFPIAPESKTMQMYYDMLVSQKKPFNLRKGCLVTTDKIQRMDLHQ